MSGKPICQVKIVDCGQTSDINTQNQQRGEQEKKLSTVNDGCNAEGSVETKKPRSNDQQGKKRKYYSSDSYSSNTLDSRSYSSQSGSDSQSWSRKREEWKEAYRAEVEGRMGEMVREAFARERVNEMVREAIAQQALSEP
uniref:Uncharacterized protein n=1 Tax=Arundo donax TaxID=35708 RepID=A0A0A9EF21_ARUDO